VSHANTPPDAIQDRARKRPEIEHALRELLRACELDLEHKDLRKTPQRVAQTWLHEFLSGFEMDPARILGDPVQGEGETELVLVRGIPFHGLCPHHLLPYTGHATVAYVPADKLAGFGRLSDLVRCYTRRLTLQERASNDIADALMKHLDARGAACLMRARHTCLSIPDNQHATEVTTCTLRGEIKTRPELRAQLMHT
jgi:GTP cyclohydrolase I